MLWLQLFALSDKFVIQGYRTSFLAAVAQLIWWVSDDYVELHIYNPLGIISVNKFVGMTFERSIAIIFGIRSAAVFAASVFPRVLNSAMTNISF